MDNIGNEALEHLSCNKHKEKEIETREWSKKKEGFRLYNLFYAANLEHSWLILNGFHSLLEQERRSWNTSY